MWAGWCSKVICDHLGHGHKTGLPYVWSADRTAANKLVGNMQKESKAIMWQVWRPSSVESLWCGGSRVWRRSGVKALCCGGPLMCG